MSKGKKKRKSGGSDAPHRSYYYSAVFPLALVAVCFLYWGAVIFFEWEGSKFLLASIGGTIALVLAVLRLAVGKFELDDHGISINRALHSKKRFKWTELEFGGTDDSLHVPDEGQTPKKTVVTRVGGGVAFTFTSWVSHYQKMRDDVRHHLRAGALKHHN